MDTVIGELQKNNTILEEKVKLRDEEIEILREQNRLLKAKLFGPSSEKSRLLNLPNQTNLFELDQNDPLEEDDESDDAEETPAKRKKRRKKLPANLLRETIIHQLTESELECGCGGVKDRCGKEEAEVLHYQKALLKVVTHLRYKYTCKTCDGVDDFKGEPVIVTAPGPARMIPGSMADETLLAHLMTAKYVDGLPFYRISTQMERLGFALSRANMSKWSIKVGARLAVLWSMLLVQAKEDDWLQMDETSLQVLGEPGRKNQTKSYMWVIRSGSATQPIILFKYSPSRGGCVAQELLAGYEGIVQTDGYEGYAYLEKDQKIIHAADWNHARRRFADVVKALGKNKREKESHATRVLKVIRGLYRIEKQIRDEGLSPEAARDLRREKALPKINALHTTLLGLRGKTPPKGLLGRAVNYALDRWEGLKVYLDHGDLPIDTNWVEGAIRPFVIGRKNWLFSGSPAGAEASAIIYSMVETAKANGWRPDAYLLHLFQNLPKIKIDPDSVIKSYPELKALLPTIPPPGINIVVAPAQ